jgi:hypothetical protein
MLGSRIIFLFMLCFLGFSVLMRLYLRSTSQTQPGDPIANAEPSSIAPSVKKVIADRPVICKIITPRDLLYLPL